MFSLADSLAQPPAGTAPPAPARVSVVITAYNQPDYIGPCVASVGAQTHADWEIVLVEDGATDGGATAAACDAAAALLPSRVRVLHTANAGKSAARNLGLLSADPAAAYVLFLDGDDMLWPGALAALVAGLAAAPDCVAAAGQIRTMEADGSPRPDHEAYQRFRVYAGQTRRIEFPEMTGDPGMGPPAVFLLRAWAARACGGFDGAMWACEDYDFSLRVSLWGPTIGVSEAVLRYRIHGANESANAAVMAAGMAHVWAKVEHYRQAWLWHSAGAESRH